MEPEVVQFESLGLRVDRATFRADVDGRPLVLEPKAFDLLVLFVTRPGRLVTKQEILDTVWAGTAVSDNALTRVVAQLRRALSDDAREARYLETVPTRGYRWIAPVRELPAASGAPSESPRQRPRIAGSLILATLVAVIGGVAWWTWRRGEAVWPPMRPAFPRQVTISGGVDAYPAFSADGRQLAFTSDRSGSFEIYTASIDRGSVDHAVTSDGRQNVEPAWSPDGRWIAYHSMSSGGIWVVEASGGAPRRVTEFGSRPSWSPGGTELAFQSEAAADLGPSAWGANLPSTIWVVPVDGGAPRPVTTRAQPPGGHSAPAWSPDGRFLAFGSSSYAGQEIWVVAADGGEPFRVSGEYFGFDPVYLDARTLAFASGEWLWTVPLGADGRPSGAPEAINVPGVGSLRHLAAGPGRLVLASGFTLDSALWSIAVAADGSPLGEPRLLTNDTRRRNSLPAISPDGQHIAVMSGLRGAGPDVWVMRADGSGLTQLTTNPEFDGAPQWMPDSRRLLFPSIRGGRAGFWQVDIATLEERQLVDLGGRDELRFSLQAVEGPRISPDGTRVAYAQLDPLTATRAIWTSALDASDERRLTPGDPVTGFPVWSPDGRSIACDVYVDGGTQIGVIDARGGSPQILTEARGQSWASGWSPDGAQVLFAGLRDGAWNLFTVPATGGTEHRITSYSAPSQFVRYPAWSPAGGLIVYEVGQVRGNVWLVPLP